MEHRCGTRQCLPAWITLYPRVGGPVRAWVRDVSISGMYVEIESGAGMISLRSLVEIEMARPDCGGRNVRCLAMVARRTPDGLGLMFDRLSPPAVARLLANRATPPQHERPRPALHVVSSPANGLAPHSGG